MSTDAEGFACCVLNGISIEERAGLSRFEQLVLCAGYKAVCV